MTELHQPVRRCLESGHVFVPGKGDSRYCSDQCADKAREKRQIVHFQHPAWSQPREACGSWSRIPVRMTTVAADVGCGNCKRTTAWKKAVAD
jgi:hypothetical protein